MKYNFDEIIDRSHTDSYNYEGWKQKIITSKEFPYSDKEVIRMWVADMDFSTPPPVLDAIRKRLDSKILGYSAIYDPSYFETLEAWFGRRYGWTIDREHVVLSPGVVPALNRLVALLTQQNENILINTPSYTPFQTAGEYNSRKVFHSPLINKNGNYEMDFDDIHRQLTDRQKNIKLFIFCHPHNPTGRVWTIEELEKLVEICSEHDIWIISDEIHCDLLRRGYQHTPLASLYPESKKIITCTAPSKTFNLAGNLMSHIFIPDPSIRTEWNRLYQDLLSPLSITATHAAYRDCEEWLEQLKEYLDDSFSFLNALIRQFLPQAKFRIPEATYLAWIDITRYAHKIPKEEKVSTYLAYQTGVLIEDSNRFVSNSDGYIRMNIACPRKLIAEAIKRIANVLED